MPQSGAIEPSASEREHVQGQIEPETALDLRREKFEHAPRPGAEIEKCAHGRLRERADDRRLDCLVGHMQLADAIPLHRVPAKIALRRLGALRPHRGETLAIARERHVLGIEVDDELAASVAASSRSPKRKKAHEPSRKRSTNPASARSRRWREMRGCDWRRMR